MKHLILLAALLAAAPGAPAYANGKGDAACRAMQAGFAPRQQELADMTARRDAAAESVEISGEAWEEAEIHRLVSPAHAATADARSNEYLEARKALAREETALQATLKQFNADVAAFNARCTR